MISAGVTSKWVSIYWLGEEKRRVVTAESSTQQEKPGGRRRRTPQRCTAKMMGALLSFCIAVGALFLWLMNTYDGDEEQPKEKQEGQQSGRKRNRRKGKREGNTPNMYRTSTGTCFFIRGVYELYRQQSRVPGIEYRCSCRLPLDL